MRLFKITKDKIIRTVLGDDLRPVHELHEYLHNHGGISFEKVVLPDGTYLSKSVNFAYGSIISTGKTEKELDENIKDAILTAFDIPSSYATEANLRKLGDQEEYVLA